MTVVDELYQNFSEVLAKLPEGELSLFNTTSEMFRKGLLLAAASFFEKQLVGVLKAHVSEWCEGNIFLTEFVRIKAIDRQYHTYFDWEASQANKFFALFGDDFKTFMLRRVKENDELAKSVKAFLEVGRERNRMVHQDFGSFSLEKTTDEIFALYQTAVPFFDQLTLAFREFAAASPAEIAK
jgi:hypothetical protein